MTAPDLCSVCGFGFSKPCQCKRTPTAPHFENWTDRGWLLIRAFSEALELTRHDEESADAELISSLAFEAAKSYGWDHENDDEWYEWTLKATGEEILIEGLRRALKGIR